MPATGTPAALSAEATGALVLTGERTLPGIADENYWFRRHEAAYLALRPFAVGARVLEAGAGEGYGAQLLTEVGAEVVALDYDAGAVQLLPRRYPRVRAVRGDVQRLPLPDDALDVVASLQVIEHSWDQPGLLAEAARVLRPAGTLLLSTPNRLTFSPGAGPGDRPLNPFHTRELDPTELVELLRPDFTVTRLLGLRHGRRLHRFERRHGSLVAAQLAGEPVTWSGAVRRVVHSVRAEDFAVSAEAIASSLDLLVVARKRTAADG